MNWPWVSRVQLERERTENVDVDEYYKCYHDALIELGVIPETFPNALPVGVDVEQLIQKLIQKPIHSASDEAIVADVFGGKETVQ